MWVIARATGRLPSSGRKAIPRGGPHLREQTAGLGAKQEQSSRLRPEPTGTSGRNAHRDVVCESAAGLHADRHANTLDRKETGGYLLDADPQVGMELCHAPLVLMATSLRRESHATRVAGFHGRARLGELAGGPGA